MFEKLEKMHMYRIAEDATVPVFAYRIIVSGTRYSYGYYAMVDFSDSEEIVDIGEEHLTIRELLDLEKQYGLVYPIAVTDTIQEALTKLDDLINTKIPKTFNEIIDWVVEVSEVKIGTFGEVTYKNFCELPTPPPPNVVLSPA